jgi:hypothetical protein
MSEEPFVPANPLEESLFHAATDPSARPQFYRLLLESEIYFLTPSPPKEPGRTVLKTETKFELVHWEGKTGHFIPFFSSLERLRAAVATSGVQYGFIALTGKAAFDILPQNPTMAVLNPGSSFGKEFLPDEMRQMADGSFFDVKTEVVPKARQIFLGQPKDYPHALVDALQKLFKRHPSVIAGYLAQMHDPSTGDPPHIMIGIECPGSMNVVAPEAVLVAQEDTQRKSIVDFVEVGSGNDSFDDYFKNHTQPFYKSEAKSRWKFW